MRFIDEAQITLIAGHGGPGCVSFRRETFVPRGGPDGGEGGAGGDIYLVASAQLGTLQDLRFKREYKAKAGEHGQGSNKAGRDGDDIEIRIPVGTLIRDAETGELIHDFTRDGERWLAASGGRGGKGNAHFVSSTFQAPKFAQPGEPGETRALKLELKLIADVAIVGFPNAGKSTLIAAMSAARPKIADYPFTTLTPNLGVVGLSDYRSFVVADVPGLIEGAHRGEGLGHRFLKHVERTRVLIHLLDGARLLELATRPKLKKSGKIAPPTRAALIEAASADALEQYRAIRSELGLFSQTLLHKPELLVINKLDVLESDAELVEELRRALRAQIHSLRGTEPQGDAISGEPWVVSAVSKRGLTELLERVWAALEASTQGAARTAARGPRPAHREALTPARPEGLRPKTLLPDDASIRMQTRKRRARRG